MPYSAKLVYRRKKIIAFTYEAKSYINKKPLLYNCKSFYRIGPSGSNFSTSIGSIIEFIILRTKATAAATTTTTKAIAAATTAAEKQKKLFAPEKKSNFRRSRFFCFKPLMNLYLLSVLPISYFGTEI